MSESDVQKFGCVHLIVVFHEFTIRIFPTASSSQADVTRRPIGYLPTLTLAQKLDSWNIRRTWSMRSTFP